MYENENSTMEVLEEPTGGEQESVVDSQESRYGDDLPEDDGQERVVDAPEPEETDGSDAGAGGGESRNPDGAGQGENHTQTREENAAIRAARLRAKREGEQEATRKADEQIAASGILNPYTGKPFSSLKDFQEYAAAVKKANLEEEAKRTGRPVAVLEEEEANREFLSDLRRRHQAAEREEEETDAQNDFIRRDVADFLQRHPEMDADKLEALERNPTFRRFCGSRFGKEPLADLFDAYVDLVQTSGAAAVAKETGRRERSTGGGNSGGVTLSPSQQRALDQWNEENPDMKMTAKEFLR